MPEMTDGQAAAIETPAMVKTIKPTTKGEWTLICFLASVMIETFALTAWLTLHAFPESALHDVIKAIGIALWVSLGVQAVGLLIFVSSNTASEIKVGVPGGGNLEIGQSQKS
jgi:hypothetical protein